VGITAGSREVPGRNACDRRHTYRIIIIILLLLLLYLTNENCIQTFDLKLSTGKTLRKVGIDMKE